MRDMAVAEGDAGEATRKAGSPTRLTLAGDVLRQCVNCLKFPIRLFNWVTLSNYFSSFEAECNQLIHIFHLKLQLQLD